MSKYEKLDSAILEYIELHSGKTPANSMMLVDIAREVNGYVPSMVYWRIVDRRTQALRKAGKIKYENRKWVLRG